MSNERRHELEKNELAILLDRVGKAIGPYSSLMAVGLVALVIGFVGWIFYRSQQTGERSDATLDLVQAVASQDAEVLMEVSENYPGTAAGAWAKVYQGQLQLSEGIQTLYRDRDEAKQLLDDAKLALESAMSGSTDPLLRSRAQLGIARAEESLGNLDAATKAYQQVIAIGESDALVKHAEQRIAALDDPKTKEFLTWFDDQNFTPADPALPPSMPDLDTLPDTPDLSLTELPGGDGDISSGDDLNLVDDAADEEKPADETTEEETPADETTEEDRPAEEPESTDENTEGSE